MYVLHHADQPHLYNGLPDDPHISPAVRLWKGNLRNHLRWPPWQWRPYRVSSTTSVLGPNETDEGEEAHAADEMAKTLSSPEKRP